MLLLSTVHNSECNISRDPWIFYCWLNKFGSVYFIHDNNKGKIYSPFPTHFTINWTNSPSHSGTWDIRYKQEDYHRDIPKSYLRLSVYSQFVPIGLRFNSEKCDPLRQKLYKYYWNMWFIVKLQIKEGYVFVVT